MNFVVEFYKSLDTFNLIIFWGIIIVIILLLVFSIIISNKNKLLKMIISSKIKEKEESIQEEIPILITNNEETKKENIIIPIPEIKDNDKIIEEEKNFIAEEHVLNYNQDKVQTIPQQQINNYQQEKIKQEENFNKTVVEEVQSKKTEEIKMPTAPYQRNVLREMSLNQTSPIGIIKPTKKENIELERAEELHNNLNIETNNTDKRTVTVQQDKINIENNLKQTNYLQQITINEPEKTIKQEINTAKKENYQKENISTDEYFKRNIIKENNNLDNNQKEKKPVKENYLEEVSRKLAESQVKDEIDRTDYEIEQEEEAIISYKELMEKKDSIKIIDEEDAIISIEELMNKKRQEEKLYNLTEEEENEKFINELKNFRQDL